MIILYMSNTNLDRNKITPFVLIAVRNSHRVGVMYFVSKQCVTCKLYGHWFFHKRFAYVILISMILCHWYCTVRKSWQCVVISLSLSEYTNESKHSLIIDIIIYIMTSYSKFTVLTVLEFNGNLEVLVK